MEESRTSTIYIVCDCQELNIRSEPSTEGSILCVVDEGSQLLIEKDIDDEWAHIYTSCGIEGYVMKRYIREG